jgi:hypothetical protein
VLSSPRMRCTLAAATLENGGRDALLLLVCAKDRNAAEPSLTRSLARSLRRQLEKWTH